MISKKSAMKTYHLFAARAPEYKPCDYTPSYSIDISVKAHELANVRSGKSGKETGNKGSN